MIRIFKYLPVIIPLVTKYVRSPQGKAAIQKASDLRRRPKTAVKPRKRT